MRPLLPQLLAAAAVMLGAAACGPKGPPPILPEAPSSQSARAILLHNCGTCHRSELPEAKPAALAVFDLAQDDWDRGLTREHLHVARKRLSATRAEKAHFDRWIEDELPKRR